MGPFGDIVRKQLNIDTIGRFVIDAWPFGQILYSFLFEIWIWLSFVYC